MKSQKPSDIQYTVFTYKEAILASDKGNFDLKIQFPHAGVTTDTLGYVIYPKDVDYALFCPIFHGKKVLNLSNTNIITEV